MQSLSAFIFWFVQHVFRKVWNKWVHFYMILSIFSLHRLTWEFKNSVEINSLSLIESEFIKILNMSILSYYIIFLISLLAGSFQCTGAGGRVCSFVWLSVNRWASWLYGSWLLFAEFLPKPALLPWTAWSPRHHQPKPAVAISASCQSVLWPDQFPHRSRQHPCHTWGKPFQ